MSQELPATGPKVPGIESPTPKDIRHYYIQHKVRSPLTTMEGLINILAEGNVDPQIIALCRKCFSTYYQNLRDFSLYLDIEEAKLQVELTRNRNSLLFLCQTMRKSKITLLVLESKHSSEPTEPDKTG